MIGRILRLQFLGIYAAPLYFRNKGDLSGGPAPVQAFDPLLLTRHFLQNVRTDSKDDSAARFEKNHLNLEGEVTTCEFQVARLGRLGCTRVSLNCSNSIKSRTFMSDPTPNIIRPRLVGLA